MIKNLESGVTKYIEQNLHTSNNIRISQIEKYLKEAEPVLVKLSSYNIDLDTVNVSKYEYELFKIVHNLKGVFIPGLAKVGGSEKDLYNYDVKDYSVKAKAKFYKALGVNRDEFIKNRVRVSIYKSNEYPIRRYTDIESVGDIYYLIAFLKDIKTTFGDVDKYYTRLHKDISKLQLNLNSSDKLENEIIVKKIAIYQVCLLEVYEGILNEYYFLTEQAMKILTNVISKNNINEE